MKIVRYALDGQTSFGILDADAVQPLAGCPSEGINTTGEAVALADVKLLAPAQPPNVVAIGLNYGRHAEESGMAVPTHPQMFLKPNTAVIGPDADIVLPAVAPSEVDYEVELCIVMGKAARNVSEDDALDYVFGYTVGNDVSARDVQLRLDAQWTRGKSFDTFCPLGPCIETELDPDNCDVTTRLNGEVMQSSNTSDLIFDCRQLVSFLSQVMTLLPGTVIMTGTPEGVGFARKPPVFLKPGDVVEVEVAGIGVLRNGVRAGA